MGKKIDESDKKNTDFNGLQRGETLLGRYVVEDMLGKGMFGQVLACADVSSGKGVAVKVLRGSERRMRRAREESSLLQRLKNADASLYRKHCVQLLDAFMHAQDYYCLVFEPLHCSLSDVMKDAAPRGLFLGDVREVARHLLSGLAFIHSTGMMHADVKATNVMFRGCAYDLAPHPRWARPSTLPHFRQPCAPILIDFGCALYVEPSGLDQPPAAGGECGQLHRRRRAGARQIWAPEMILGLHWDQKADVWSLGCLVAMLYTGERLFRVHDDMEHLAMIEHKLDTHIPSSMGRNICPRIIDKGVAFDRVGRLAWPDRARSRESIDRVRDQEMLRHEVRQNHTEFASFLHLLLSVDPGRRPSAAEALGSHFLHHRGTYEE